MIPQSKYLPAQMNGPVVNAWALALEEELADAVTIAEYIYNLKIANAQENELENIGRLIGFPRPLVPDGFNDENLLLLTTLPQTVDPLNGLSEVGLEIGGALSSLETSESNYMGLEIYRRFLPKVAVIKRYGITLKSVDDICALMSNDYTIEYDENKDIAVTFGADIGYKNVYILTELFYRFSTAPQVLIFSGD